MTSGTVIYGTTPGYYRKRSWSGGNGGPGENTYSWSINNSLLIPVQYRRVGSTNWLNGSMNTFRPTYLTVSGASNDCLNKATQKVWEDLTQSRFNAGIFAGESRESYRMICDIVKNIASAVHFAKRGQWNKAFRFLSMSPRESHTGVAANSYMMMHFGILPLLGDLKAAYDYMRTSYKVVKRVKKMSGFKEADTKALNGVTWQREYRCLAEVRGNVEMVALNEADRLGLNDLASVAWELTKLSWIVDWIIPVGNFLSAVNAHNKTEGTEFWVTRMETTSVLRPVNSWVYEIKPFDSSAFYTLYLAGPVNTRYAMSGLPWVFPTIKNPLGDNLSRWATSAAFLRQSVGR